MDRKLTFIELNEFSLNLIKNYSQKYNLKNLKEILNSEYSKTYSIDKKEHYGLDPWVQWVSIHTGKPSNVHDIRGIGESFNLKHNQIWDYLGKKNITSGIWGAMNGINKNSKTCKFFVPDPWSYSQLCFPTNLSGFIALPRFYAKNYIKPNKFKFAKSIFKTFIFFIRFKNFLVIKENLFFIFNILYRYGINNGTIFSIFDLCSTMLFIDYKKKYNPDFTILFLNSLAHNQHHNWEKGNKKLIACFHVLDRIFYVLRKSGIFEEPYLIANGLSQTKTFKNYFIYRQKDPEKLFKDLEIDFLKIEQAMTNDGQIFFKDKFSLINASEILKKIKIENKNLFSISTKIIENEKIYILFYQLDFFNNSNSKTFFKNNKKTFLFRNYFVEIANRTGEHINYGDILYKKIFIHKKIENHKIYNYIINFFK